MNALEDLTSKTMNFISDIQRKIDGNTYNLDELYDAMHLINWAYNFGKLTNIKQLNLKDNELRYLPDSMGDLINLECLNLSKNKLERLPDSII